MARRPYPITLLAVMALTATLTACGGAKAPPVVTPSPTATLEPTTGPGATITPTPEPSAYGLVYRQFGPLSDTIWRLSPSDPADRQPLATIGHSEGWGTFASVSPKRDAIAYTVLPEGAQDEERDARAFVLPIGGSPQLVADGVDLRSTPLWSPGGRFLYLRRNTGSAISIIEVDTDREEEERELVSLSSSDVFGLFPIGLSSDGQTLYYAQIASDGTSFVAYSFDSRQTSLLVLASAQIAREYDLSPDGGDIAYTVGGRAFIADLAAGTVKPIESDLLAGTTQLQPKWRPDGTLALGQFPSGDQPSPAVVIDPATGQGASLAPADSGFDAPLGWSPDGKLLAVSAIDGPSQALVLITGQGQRLLVTDEPDFLFVGWI